MLEKIKERNQRIKFVEVRRYPRIKKLLSLKIKNEEFDIVTESENISACGVYCSIDRYLAPYTKLAIRLSLPLKEKKEQINCRGVVVRAEENLDNTYNIAIYFNEIKKIDQKKISRYVDYYLKKEKN